MTTDTDTMDRQLTMLCTPTLVWNADGSIGATIAFSQTNGVPAAMNGRNGSDGSINLANMPHDPAYNDNIDVTIMLDTSRMVTQDGSQPVAGRCRTNSRAVAR
ncbi:MAG: hypothetical protein ACKO1O_02775 [Erythrobacter sp.]